MTNSMANYRHVSIVVEKITPVVSAFFNFQQLQQRHSMENSNIFTCDVEENAVSPSWEHIRLKLIGITGDVYRQPIDQNSSMLEVLNFLRKLVVKEYPSFKQKKMYPTDFLEQMSFEGKPQIMDVFVFAQSLNDGHNLSKLTSEVVEGFYNSYGQPRITHKFIYASHRQRFAKTLSGPELGQFIDELLVEGDVVSASKLLWLEVEPIIAGICDHTQRVFLREALLQQLQLTQDEDQQHLFS